MGTDADESIAFLRLLHLASPALPIGAFAYSQGLEPAVAAGLVSDEASAGRWILGILTGPFAHVDLPLFARLHAAHAAGDDAGARRWGQFLLASRATAELQIEDRHLGSALARVLVTMGIADADPSTPTGTPTFAGLFALAAARFRLDRRRAAQAMAFTWAEAQTGAAVRLVPLGQSAGVRILAEVGRAIPAAVDAALALPDDDVGAAAPLHALLSCAHETQYSRLFRS